MTLMTVERAPAPSTCDVSHLRDQVRDRFAEEYLGLRDIERPALLEMLDAEDVGTDRAKVSRALTIIDYHLAAIRDFLGPETGTPGERAGSGSCVCLEQSEGPRWFLLAALPFEDPRVIASDSALGRALIGARPDQTVVYPSPHGLQKVRVLAVETRS
jgi:hypothetical protein